MCRPRRRESWLPFTEPLEGHSHASRTSGSTTFHNAICIHLLSLLSDTFDHYFNPEPRPLTLLRKHLQCLQCHLRPKSLFLILLRSRSHKTSTLYVPGSWGFTPISHHPEPVAAYSQRAKGNGHHPYPSQTVPDNAQQVGLEAQPDSSPGGSPEDPQRIRSGDEFSRRNSQKAREHARQRRSHQS
ncbi:hypothetical protein KVT40_001166 [Elsinoe batatas]|uniref:Uncharacterized protein n=1 Tax=Elsinoe batatas TaxID=2601811 RepID=A0A8K0PJC2_9PEZI|nr:hypothetical protein KVT40_001166 [Elsinoe batatas]